MVTLFLMVPQVIWQHGRLLGVRANHPGQRVRDEERRTVAAAAGRAAARVPPQVLHVQQVPAASSTGGQVLHVGRQSGLRAGLAQTPEELSGDAHGAQGQGGTASSEQGLKRRQFRGRWVDFNYSFTICSLQSLVVNHFDV